MEENEVNERTVMVTYDEKDYLQFFWHDGV